MEQSGHGQAARVLGGVLRQTGFLAVVILLLVIGAAVTALLPPLLLEKVIDRLTGGLPIPFYLAVGYFGLTVLAGLLDAAREGLLTIFGQKVTRGLRHALCAKLSRLPADYFATQEPGVTASRFVGDVDLVESLFTSGIISMFADACKVLSIFAIIFVKNRGLALLLLFLVPLLFWFTRIVQKRMLAAQLMNRVAVGKVTNHVPETIRCIRAIHTLRKERYMREKYDRYIEDSYAAVEKTNFYDAVYSPVILILNAIVIAVVMLLSASGNASIQSFFGMSVGTAVAVIAYISQVFGPLESIGMEIQTIQSAVAGLHRIEEFLELPERWETEDEIRMDELTPAGEESACVELRDVTFGYDADVRVLDGVSFKVAGGEQVTLAGRTGAGKSTIFKLLLGLYRPQRGQVLIYGKDASRLPDSVKRKLFGYVEQSFRMVPGTVREQITLFDESISAEQVEMAARTVGLHETIMGLPQGYETVCAQSLFSQGQWQLLSIARAIAAEPVILLLDEITANLDSDTEQEVLAALRSATENRTVISISHRLYEQTGMRMIEIGGRCAV